MRQEEVLQISEQADHFAAARWTSATPAEGSAGTLQSRLSWHKLSRVKLLDVFERAVILVVFGHFAFVMLSTGKAGVLSLILLASESLPVILIVTRRAANALSERPLDWLLALIGTILPLLALPVAPIRSYR
ncbi:MAG: hypothetical protein ACRD3W_13210 [Terriglobales bacterium]